MCSKLNKNLLKICGQASSSNSHQGQAIKKRLFWYIICRPCIENWVLIQSSCRLQTYLLKIENTFARNWKYIFLQMKYIPSKLKTHLEEKIQYFSFCGFNFKFQPRRVFPSWEKFSLFFFHKIRCQHFPNRCQDIFFIVNVITNQILAVCQKYQLHAFLFSDKTDIIYFCIIASKNHLWTS